MAIPSDTVWEVETTGADTNGGGFSAANKGATGIDMTYGAGFSIVSFTSTLSAVGTTTLTDSGAGFVNTMLGNIINIVGKGFYCIAAFLTTSTVTVDRALGTFSTTSGKVGGVLASFGMIGGIAVSGNTVPVKNGTYTITTASTNVSNGCFSNSNGIIVYGFNTNRTPFNNDTRPTIILNSGVSSATIFVGALGSFQNFILDGNSQTTSKGVGNATLAYNCKGQNFTAGAFNGISIACEATICSGTTVFTGAGKYFCVAHANSILSFSGSAYGCIAYGNTATGFDTTAVVAINCTSYGNTGASSDGFVAGGSISNCVNCIAEANGRYGFNQSNISRVASLLLNCAAFNNGSSAIGFSAGSQQLNFINTGVSPFIDAANQDFRLNDSATGGKLLKSLGFPSTWPAVNASMLNYLDIGAAQHTDPTGGTPQLINGGKIS